MIPFALLICFFCISESQYIDSVPEKLKAELELQMYTEDMGANDTLGNNQVVFFHHLIVYGEKKMDKHFPWYLLLYDKVFNPKFDFEKCYEADRENALEMIE